MAAGASRRTRWSRRAVAGLRRPRDVLAILHAQLPEAAHAEQQAAVEALQREMSARGGGGTPLADVLDAAVCAVEPLRVVVLSEGRRLKALHEALAADLAEVVALKAAGEEPDQDDCDEVFAEDPEGNEGALCRWCAGSSSTTRSRTSTSCGSQRHASAVERTDSASQFVEAIMLVDETKEAASIADALSWGFGVAPGEEVARDERISPEGSSQTSAAVERAAAASLYASCARTSASSAALPRPRIHEDRFRPCMCIYVDRRFISTRAVIVQSDHLPIRRPS